MPPNETEKQYNELKKKFKLPEFKELDFDFEISDLEETKFLIRAIIRRIAEKLDFYTTIIEDIIQPDASNLYAMHEGRFFDDDEKKQMYDFYKMLMQINRHSVVLSLEHNEKEEAEFISGTFLQWKEIKKELVRYINRMKDSWKEETYSKEDVGYLG